MRELSPTEVYKKATRLRITSILSSIGFLVLTVWLCFQYKSGFCYFLLTVAFVCVFVSLYFLTEPVDRHGQGDCYTGFYLTRNETVKREQVWREQKEEDLERYLKKLKGEIEDDKKMFWRGVSDG